MIDPWPNCNPAFQPVVDTEHSIVLGYEALARGEQGQCWEELVAAVSPEALPAFDRFVRVNALSAACELGLTGKLFVNCHADDIFQSKVTSEEPLVREAKRLGFPINQMVYEFGENALASISEDEALALDELKEAGALIAIDGFMGGGGSLAVLRQVAPDVIKLDSVLTRGVYSDGVKQAIVRALVNFSRDLGIVLIATCVEQRKDVDRLSRLGVTLFQGHFFGKPEVGSPGSADSVFAASPLN